MCIDMAEEQWEVLGSETVLDQPPFLRVTMQKVRLPDGRVIKDWPIIDTRDYVNVVALNEAGEVMVIEGYKHGVGRSNWQVVGGYLEPGEDPMSAVQRELLEETGYRSDDWQALGRFIVDVNRRTAVGHFYLARNAYFSQPPAYDDLEDIVVRWVSLDELRQAMMDGRVAGLSYAANIALALIALGE